MDLSYHHAVTTLQPGQLLRLRPVFGRRFAVVQGTAWVTQDGDPRDTVVEAGADFVFKRPGMAIIQALGARTSVSREAGIEIEPCARGRQSHGLAHLWRRLGEARRRRRARRALSLLSERELRDIGIQRSQIEMIEI